MNHRLQTLLRTAVLAVPLAATPLLAQTAVDNRARTDANNRIGSGGTNSTVRNFVPNATNNLVTGNVTGGAAFRGNVGYRDAREFRGTTAGSGTDAFLRNSSGVTSGGTVINNAQVVRPFYGDARFATPPQDFERVPGTGGYLPARAPVYNPADLRLNAGNMDLMPSLPRPGAYALPGQVDANLASGGFGSPLGAGSPDLDIASLQQPTLISSYTQIGRPLPPGVQVSDLQRFRQELMGLSGQPSEQRARPGEQNAAANANAPGFAGPGNAALSGQAANASVTAQQRTGNLEIPTESPYKPLAESARQSTQIAALQERLADFYESRHAVNPNETGPRAGRTEVARGPETPDEPREGEDRPGENRPGENRPDETRPGEDPLRRDPLNPRPGEQLDPNAGPLVNPNEAPPTDRNQPPRPPKPLRITSLASGVQAPGLGDLMKSAETAMQEGKFATAIRQYEAAGQVAPNNGLVLVGRGTAELGASFYRRADATLREAFTMDPSLMLAQYDLTQLLPEDRLQFVVRELKDLANKDATQTTPVFLLAFIAYNTGNEVNAAGLLDQADKRAGGNDPVLKLVREHWSLPGLNENK